jgi:hypothetical protein
MLITVLAAFACMVTLTLIVAQPVSLQPVVRDLFMLSLHGCQVQRQHQIRTLSLLLKSLPAVDAMWSCRGCAAC